MAHRGAQRAQHNNLESDKFRRRTAHGWLSVSVTKLGFKINQNQNFAREISEILETLNIQKVRNTIRNSLVPTYLDLSDNHRTADPSLAISIRYLSGRRGRTQDDSNLTQRHRPVSPAHSRPPMPAGKCLQRRNSLEDMITSYDLNALSRTVSVKDAMIYYENEQSLLLHRR